MASNDRTYSTGFALMELDGTDVGIVLTAEGGEPFAEVVNEPPVGVRVPKRIVNVHYPPIFVTIGPSMDARFYDWVSSAFDGNWTRKDGAIVLLDYNWQERERLEWKHALVSEVALPAVDAASKDTTSIRVGIQPESTRRVPGSGASRRLPAGSKNRSYLSGRFRFSISGLEDASSRIQSVDRIVVRRRAVEHVGEERLPDETGRVLDVSNVAITVGLQDVAGFADWFDTFVIRGRSEGDAERTATLNLMEPNSRTDLLQVTLEGLGIVRITRQRQVEGPGALATARIEMYCERVGVPTWRDPEPPADSEPATTEAETEPIPADSPPDAIAIRLLRSAEESEADEGTRGRALGRAWAAGHARLDELTEIAALVDTDNWTALALADGHTLITFLANSKLVAVTGTGGVDLRRDRFVDGLVAGAAEVYQQVAPHLEELRKS